MAMYCIKCGSQNSDDAAFCRKCGNQLEDEEETRIARRGEEKGRAAIEASGDADHEVIFTVSPTVKFVMAGYALAVLCAFLFVALFSLVLPGFSPYIAIIIGIFFLIVPAFYHLRQKLVRYSLTDTTIEIDRGFISRTTQNVPLRRVQDITVSATFAQRLLGFGDIVIDNASETGGKVILDNIDSPRKYADLLLKQMRRLDR